MACAGASKVRYTTTGQFYFQLANIWTRYLSLKVYFAVFARCLTLEKKKIPMSMQYNFAFGPTTFKGWENLSTFQGLFKTANPVPKLR